MVFLLMHDGENRSLDLNRVQNPGLFLVLMKGETTRKIKR